MSDTKAPVKRAEIRRPELDTVYTINADGSRNFLHPADVQGRWQNRKKIAFTVLIAIYVLLPWITINGHPAVHIDLPGRAAYLFGRSFTNQDFYLMFFLVSGVGFGLFVLTSLFGRVWCGYACPQTVFLEGVYRKVERWLEGPRTTRIRRNLGPWTWDKTWRKFVKQMLFIVFSAAIAHVFLSYFIPARELIRVVTEPPSAHWSAFFWTMFWTGVMYFNYAWFREQTCLVICPYGRLQSALIDADTVIVGYDRKRGEPRSKVNDEGGDCVDCQRCVVVCPTGIDIRNGLQMECIGCANCVDACDEIMGKLGKPRGLVRYDSKRGFDEGRRRKLVRPRSIVYAVLGLIGLSVFAGAASRREPFEVKVLRARGLPYVLEEHTIRNLYTLRIENKEARDRVFFLEAEAEPQDGTPEPEFIVPQPRVIVSGMDTAEIPIFATIPRGTFTAPFPVEFSVRDSASGREREVEVNFRGP